MSFNLAVILSETAGSSPDRPVAVFDGGQLSYRQLDQASDRLAAALAAAGVESGDPVALQLPNIPQFLISYFGILKAGGVVVPLNVLLRAPEIAFHLGDSGARILDTDHQGTVDHVGAQSQPSLIRAPSQPMLDGILHERLHR